MNAVAIPITGMNFELRTYAPSVNQDTGFIWIGATSDCLCLRGLAQVHPTKPAVHGSLLMDAAGSIPADAQVAMDWSTRARTAIYATARRPRVAVTHYAVQRNVR